MPVQVGTSRSVVGPLRHGLAEVQRSWLAGQVDLEPLVRGVWGMTLLERVAVAAASDLLPLVLVADAEVDDLLFDLVDRGRHPPADRLPALCSALDAVRPLVREQLER